METEDLQFNEQKFNWLCRLGGIIRSLYPDISLVVDRDEFKIYLSQSSYGVNVIIDDNGGLDWDDYADCDIDSNRLSHDLGVEFYESKIDAIEEMYYSDEYEGTEQTAVFMNELEDGKYSIGKFRFFRFLKYIIVLGLIIWLITL